MFTRPGYCVMSLPDRYASEAPMLTRPWLASAMPVPDPVEPEVMVMFGLAVEYALCQLPNSGNSSELPVSVISLPEELADEVDGDVDPLALEGELEPQAAASMVSGTRAAAVHTKRIFLATWEYSFT